MISLLSLDSKLIEKLHAKKNLLAFSGGSDSTALFFILKAYKVEFDIAIVHYGVRKEANEELLYAKQLAKMYAKKCYNKEVKLETKNFEANARLARYDYFKEITQQFSYETLITGHHLQDRLEWFFMQFSKGAGVSELLGMSAYSIESTLTKVRPLLDIDKGAILHFLDMNNIDYFEDESNSDTRYKRNEFRQWVTPFLEKYSDGIRQSFT